jgi:hypothetical protein
LFAGFLAGIGAMVAMGLVVVRIESTEVQIAAGVAAAIIFAFGGRAMQREVDAERKARGQIVE